MEATEVFVQIRLEKFLGKTAIDSEDERFSIADCDIQPVELVRVGQHRFHA